MKKHLIIKLLIILIISLTGIFIYSSFFKPLKINLQYHDGQIISYTYKRSDKVLPTTDGYIWSNNPEYVQSFDIRKEDILYEIIDIKHVVFENKDGKLAYYFKGEDKINVLKSRNVYFKDLGCYCDNELLFTFNDLINQDINVSFKIINDEIVFEFDNQYFELFNFIQIAQTIKNDAYLYVCDTTIYFSDDTMFLDLDMFVPNNASEFYLSNGQIKCDDNTIIDLSIFTNNNIQYVNGNYGYYIDNQFYYLWKIQNLKTATILNNSFYRNLHLEQMNQLAKEIKLENTFFNTVSGYDKSYTNHTTAKDLVKLILYASKNEILSSIWNQKDFTLTESSFGRNVTVKSTVNSHANSHYLADYYPILGGKTGSMHNIRENLGVIVLDPSTNIKYIVFASVGYDNLKKTNRFIQAKALMDIAVYLHKNNISNITNSNDISNITIKNHVKELEKNIDGLSNGCVIVYPDDNFNIDELYHSKYYLYSFNGDELIQSFSVAKIANVITALPHIDNLNNTITLVKDDISAGSGPKLYANETMTYLDALKLIMLPSSNTMANVLARYSGQAIFYEAKPINEYSSILKYHR